MKDQDILQKYIECRRFIHNHEQEAVTILLTKHKNKLQVDGYKYRVVRHFNYAYTEATQELGRKAQKARDFEREGGIARANERPPSVRMTEIAPRVVLDPVEK